jgi:hypothetical protein
MEPITKELVNKWAAAHQAAGGLEGIIEDRITYIIETWFNAFGGKLDTWYFDGANEGEVGDLSPHMDANSISCIYTQMKIVSFESQVYLRTIAGDIPVSEKDFQ